MLTLLVVVAALAAGPTTVRGSKAALLIIDVQDCFLSGGSLAVKDGDEVIPVINKMRETFDSKFSMVVISQDWHCPDHVSFASQHEGAQPYSVVSLTYNDQGELCYGESVTQKFPHAVDCKGSGRKTIHQTLWPDHCIQNVTTGPSSAEFSTRLTRKDTDIIVRKGYYCGVDSYSAFFNNGGFSKTELDSLLKEKEIELVVVVGLALDYCVYYTAKDAHALGYKVLTVTDAARGVAPDTTAAALEDMKNLGIQLILSGDLEGALQDNSKAIDLGIVSFGVLAILGTVLVIYLTRT